MSFGLVIPCYNEALRLKLDAYCDFLDAPVSSDYSICFVNDGSTDNTGEILKLIKRQYPGRVEVLNVPKNRGKAEAVRTGFIHFMQQDEIEGVGFVDADLSTNFKEYSGLVNFYRDDMNRQCLIFGSRPLGRKYKYQRKWSRTAASIIARAVIRRVIRLPIMDSQCGAKVMSVELAERCFAKPFKTRWLFDVELFMRIRKLMSGSAECELHEVQLKEWVDVRGSKITLMDAIEMPVQVLWIWYHYTLIPRFRLALSRFTSYFMQKSEVSNRF